MEVLVSIKYSGAKSDNFQKKARKERTGKVKKAYSIGFDTKRLWT